MSTRTEREYREAIAAAGLLEGAPDELPELAVLRAAVERQKPPAAPRVVTTSVDAWMDDIRAAVGKGLKPQALWDKLRRDKPDEFKASLSAVKRAVLRVKRERGVQPEDVVIPVETAPGEVAQVDFGEVGRLYDPATGKVRRAWVFVMVLGFSRHMFARIVFDQKVATWLELHVAAFEYFGGVPRVIVPDNLKSAVIKGAFGAGDRHEVGLNRTYRELARHYGFKVDPTPTYSPEKKGKVESAVKYVKGNWLPTSEAETLDEANADLAVWCDKTASVRIHRETGRRPVDAFRDEQPALLPLPTAIYEPIVWKQATVHPDSHVEFDGRLYSVPWRTVGRKVWVRATPSSVYILLDDVRIATHERRVEGRRSTCEAHLPEHRRDLAHRSVDYWVERAAQMGQPVVDYINEVLESDDVLSKLRDVQAIVEHLESYPHHRAQGACRRASFYSNYSYQGVKRILLSAKDLEPLPVAVVPDLGQLDRPRFARTAAELLASSLETADEPH